MYTRKDFHRTVLAIILIAVHHTISAQNNNEFGYPIAPELNSSINAPVGKIADELSVSQIGAASYSFGIEMPTGVSGSTPSLALNYNSQSGNGIAGWGCNLTGLSVIMRMPSDIYHDGHANGINHNMDGPFSLDGQRLIKIGSLMDGDSLMFCLEFSPQTLVVLHGLSSSSQGQTWFSVHTPDGNDCEYGHTSDSQQRYSVQNTTKVNAWYVSNVRNPIGAQCHYSYTQSYNSIYLQNICYGNNVIRFNYENRPDTISTTIEGVPVKVTMRLSDIRTATIVNGIDSIFRRYTLTYTNTDMTTTSFSRLIRVDVANGAGESLRPTMLNWAVPMAFSCQKDNPNFEYNFDYLGALRESMSFLAADLNGDGLSDIAQFGRTNFTYGNNNHNFLQIHLARINNNGETEFVHGNNAELPEGFTIGAEEGFAGWSCQEALPVAVDVNGDGIMEVIAPEYYFSPDANSFKLYVYIDGICRGGVEYNDLHAQNANDVLWTTGDYNNDGISEFVVIEKNNDGTHYYGVLMGGYQNVGNPHEAYNKSFRFNLPAKPKHLFSADMDSDGMTDIIVFYDQGYSVIHNTGNWLGENLPSPYIPQPTDYSLPMDSIHVWLGDFNGDLIPDFLVCKPNNGDFYFELGNGDGSLTQKTACTLDIYDQPTEKDDDRFFCQILDFDGDGKSDVVVHKSVYDSLYLYNRSEVYWLRSDGNSLTIQSHASTYSETEGEVRYYTQGDFNGDGLQEIASYSFDCYNGSGAPGNAVFRIYRNGVFCPSSGKLTGVTDGLNRQTQITYTTLTDKAVRLQDTGNDVPNYPVVKVSAPLHVVSSIGTDNGAAGHSTKNYRYGTLLGHVQGRGLLGMNCSRTEDVSTGLVARYDVTQWHPTALVPFATIETDSLDGLASTRSTTYDISIYGSGNDKRYWCNPQIIVNYDFDGNRTQEYFEYDRIWNMACRHTITYGPHDSEHTTIFDCVYKGGRYRPIDIGHYKNRQDDADTYMDFTYYAYNDMGLVDTVIVHSDTELAVTKAYTYDTYGNRLTETTSANGVTPLVNTWQYDNSHRFVTRHTENGLTEILYTHDLWGNVLTETDNTRTAHPLTQTNTYDGWGNLTATISPIGIRNTYTKGWGNSQTMRYYEVVQGKKQPWKKTWFDAVGREVKTESISDQGLPTSKTTTYNNNGQAVSILNQTGNVSITQTSSYDNRGRCVSTSMSDTQGTLSQTRTYAYGSNWKSETFNGRTIKQTYNSRGDVVSVATPQDTVLYHYYSSGLPSSVTSCGHTVTMEYDIAGNRTKLTDPDAGTMTYTYDGLGRVISQTDARNQVLNFTYDSYGRIKTGPTGGSPLVTNFYGTNSSNKNLLIMVRVTPADKVNYTYDDYGRMITRKRLIPNYGFRTFTYTYDNDGLLASKTYPDGTTTAFQYDAYGNHVSTTIGDTIVWQMTNATGSTTQYLLANTFLMDETYNAYGMPTSKTLRRNGS